jgi:Myosin head (motor domain)
MLARSVHAIAVDIACRGVDTHRYYATARCRNSATLLCKCRCIKPNSKMEVGKFDNKYVVDQLQCLGVLQTCEVSVTIAIHTYYHVHSFSSCSCALLSAIILK